VFYHVSLPQFNITIAVVELRIHDGRELKLQLDRAQSSARKLKRVATRIVLLHVGIMVLVLFGLHLIILGCAENWDKNWKFLHPSIFIG